MGKHLVLCTSEAIPEAEFSDFVRDYGCGQDEATLDVACDEPEGTFWIYGPREALRGKFESPYLDGPVPELDEKLGRPLTACFPLYLSSAPGSANVALRFAERFAARWHSVVECIAYGILPAARVCDPDARMPSIHGSQLAVFSPVEPDIRGVLASFGGLTLDRRDQAWAVKAAKLRSFAPTLETMDGFFCVGNHDIWIASEQVTEDSWNREPEPSLAPVVSSILGTPPRAVIRIVMGIETTPEVDEAALAFARHLMTTAGGALGAVFATILSAEELHEWVASDYGWRIG